jgi:hypothetical protein
LRTINHVPGRCGRSYTHDRGEGSVDGIAPSSLVLNTDQGAQFTRDGFGAPPLRLWWQRYGGHPGQPNGFRLT